MTRMRRQRRAALGALSAIVIPATLGGQAPRSSHAAVLARADSAYATGDHARARGLYTEVLAADSTDSRAVFRLAQLEESNARALALYRRYVALEPADPWGHMAEGDLLARMGRWHDGLAAYARAGALAPGERDVAIGRARVFTGAGRQREAAAELAAWIRKHPEDGEAWDLLGRSYLRSRRPRAAAIAFDIAAQQNASGAGTRLVAARAASAPAITPAFSSTGDSDGNRATALSAVIDFMAVDGARIGIGARREDIRNDVEDVQGTGAEVSLVSMAGDGVQFTLRGGAMQFTVPILNPVTPQPGPPQGNGPPIGSAPVRTESWTSPDFDARLRARLPGNGPSIDVRGEHAPLVYSTQLIADRASRSEARMTMELPVAALRVRGMGRLGVINASDEPANRRTAFEGALLLPLGRGRAQPAVQYREVRYERPTLAGYFAPRRAATAEAALYVESGDGGRVSIAADLGAGLQRVTEHGSLPGPWTRALRAWTQVSLALGPSRAWYVEAEACDAPFGLEGVATAGNWRYLAINSGIRWPLR